MNRLNHWILGLALVVAFIMTLGLAAGSQAQQNDPGVYYGPEGKDYNSGYYGYDGRGYNRCPMGPGYGYAPPANQDSRQYNTRTRNRDYRGARCPWNSGYARGYRGRGCW